MIFFIDKNFLVYLAETEKLCAGNKIGPNEFPARAKFFGGNAKSSLQLS
jgi:hypothetical protein